MNLWGDPWVSIGILWYGKWHPFIYLKGYLKGLEIKNYFWDSPWWNAYKTMNDKPQNHLKLMLGFYGTLGPHNTIQMRIACDGLSIVAHTLQEWIDQKWKECAHCLVKIASSHNIKEGRQKACFYWLFEATFFHFTCSFKVSFPSPSRHKTHYLQW